MKTIESNFEDPEVNQLLKKHFFELRSVSPKGSTHVLDIEGLQNKSIKFWSIYEHHKLIGCGALKFLDSNHGEFKSIRVADSFRKKGYGKKVITVLFEKSKELGINKISVETGSGEFFLPARRLFKEFGFEECEPFGHYVNDSNSCYMSLEI
tara:strand:+ start:372 stop:827 length:456 start_codon:yes stop_codon:yes gene_type:complete